MKLLKLALVICAAFLTACATGYSKPGASYNDYLDDRYSCMKEVAGVTCVNAGL